MFFIRQFEDSTQELESCKIKTPESIRVENEVQESSNLAYNSVKINGVKEEVLEYQLVITSRNQDNRE